MPKAPNIKRLRQILPQHLGKLRSAFFTIVMATLLSFFLIRAMPGDFLHQRAVEIMKQQHIHYPQAYEVAKAQYGRANLGTGGLEERT